MVVGSYLSHNESSESLSVERIVKDLDVKKLVTEDMYKEYKSCCGKIDADSLIDFIKHNKIEDVSDYFDHIDKEQLNETLLQIKLKFEDPGFHWNWLYISLTFASFLVALCSFFCTYPKSEDDK